MLDAVLAIDETTPQRLTRVRWLVRCGCAAKGVIYVAVGVLAAFAALDLRRSPEDTRGALKDLFEQPLGAYLLAVLAFLLAGYALWRLCEAVTGHDADGTRKNIFWRFHRLFSAAVHSGLALSAMRLFVHRDGGVSSEQASKTLMMRVMNWPLGESVAVGAGLIALSAGIYQLYRSYSGATWRDLEFGRTSMRIRRLIVAMGRIGEFTRGVIFLVISGFILHAVIRMEPSEVRGFAGALQALEQLPHGGLFLLLAAVGLTLFGLFLILSARFQKP